MCVRVRESVCVGVCVCVKETDLDSARVEPPRDQHVDQRAGRGPARHAEQGQIDGLLNQLPYKCYLEAVASVGD